MARDGDNAFGDIVMLCDRGGAGRCGSMTTCLGELGVLLDGMSINVMGDAAKAEEEEG